MTAVRTVADCLDAATRRLRLAGVALPRLDAGVLLGHVLDADRATLIGHPDLRLDRSEDRRFAALVRRRAAREPIAQLTGAREFWSLSIGVGPTVLAPRPDSETLIEAALDRLADRGRPWRVLDLGTGSFLERRTNAQRNRFAKPFALLVSSSRASNSCLVICPMMPTCASVA